MATCNRPLLNGEKTLSGVFEDVYGKRIEWIVDPPAGVTGFCHEVTDGMPNTVESTRTSGVPVAPVGRASEMVYNAQYTRVLE